jgi:hypothetical protein
MGVEACDDNMALDSSDYLVAKKKEKETDLKLNLPNYETNLKKKLSTRSDASGGDHGDRSPRERRKRWLAKP